MRISLSEAIIKLQNGEVVAIPTETVYGLAADATNESALRQIYAIKARPADNPLIVHIGSYNQVLDWTNEFSPLAQKLANAFWPGPFTLVLPAKASVSNILRAGEPTVALRVPNHPLALQLLQQSGLSLAAPSANKYTQLSPTSAAHVAIGLGDAVPVLDGGACKVGVESTIVSVHSDDWQLLRHGMITEAQVANIAGKPALRNIVNLALPKAPGQHMLHYSPRTPTLLFKDKITINSALEKFAKENITCAALVIGKENINNKENTIYLSNKPKAVAEALYDALHRLDALSADRILVKMPPNNTEWATITDRLTRAGQFLV